MKYWIIVVSVLMAILAHSARAADPNAIPPEVLKAAQAAAAAGRPFEIVKLPSSSETASASGPSSTASGDGLKQSVAGTAPDLGLSGGARAKGGDTKVSQSANAFAPFDPSGSNIAGWSFIAIGIGIIIAANVFPLIPLSAGWVSIAVGVILLIAPTFLNSHPFVAVVLAGAAGMAALFIVGYKAKWFDQQIGPGVQQELVNKGQAVAAGALAHIEASKPFASARTVARASKQVAEAKRVIRAK